MGYNKFIYGFIYENYIIKMDLIVILLIYLKWL